MKKIIMTMFAVTMTIMSVTSQEAKQQPPPRKTPEERAEAISNRMTKALELNADQQQKVKELILKKEKERKELQDKAKGTREKMEAEMETDLQKILTPAQFEKFKKRKEENKKRQSEKRPERSGKEEAPIPPDLDH
jgi:periplasmic protein CpxP/Spy